MMDRDQLEAHLELHGWRPARSVNLKPKPLGRRMYLLRNAGVVVTFDGGVGWQVEMGAPSYFINNAWEFCAWSDIPDTEQRAMARLILEKEHEQQT